MTNFHYAAKDASGKTVEGDIEAKDRSEALGELRKQHLYATVLARHPGLANDHTRVQRIMLSERMEAANLARAGLRYKLVDRLNGALKRSPLHGTIKGIAERTIEVKRRSKNRSHI